MTLASDMKWMNIASPVDLIGPGGSRPQRVASTGERLVSPEIKKRCARVKTKAVDICLLVAVALTFRQVLFKNFNPLQTDNFFNRQLNILLDFSILFYLSQCFSIEEK